MTIHRFRPVEEEVRGFGAQMLFIILWYSTIVREILGGKFNINSRNYESGDGIAMEFESAAYRIPVHRYLASPYVRVYTDETGWKHYIEGFQFKKNKHEPDIMGDNGELDDGSFMGTKIIQTIIFVMMTCCVLFFLCPLTVKADMGPKPSLQIEFTNIEETVCYGTILSGQSATRFSNAWNGTEEDARYSEEDYEIWKIFAGYEDEDGFYFFQNYSDCSETTQLNWRRDPPKTFKIVLYFPENDTYYASPIYQTYAFHSYFKVDLSKCREYGIKMHRSYNYTWELISLATRSVITILLEVFVALRRGYREKKQLQFFAGVNIATQLILNVLLNLTNYSYGFLAYILVYIFLEIIVFVIEAVTYALLVNKFSSSPQKKGKVVLYALSANLASFGSGLLLSCLLPGIFY